MLAPIIQLIGKLRTVDFGSRFMSYLPLRDAKLLNSSINSMRRYSVNIYNEKKETMTATDAHANPQRTETGGSDSDVILSALCTLEYHILAYREGTDYPFFISKSK